MQKRVVFMGTPDYATTILKKLLEDEGIKVEALFTQEDKPVGRKQILTPPHTKKFLLENNIDIKIYQPKSLKQKEVEDILKKISPDFIVVAAYGKILPKNILDIAPCINLHASILPKYRGASPIQDSIINDEEYLGVTAMLMNEKLDEGDMLAFSFLKQQNFNAIEAFLKLSDMAASLCVEVIKRFDTLSRLKQLDAVASYSKKIKKEDGLIEFLDAKKVYLKYLAYIYWPKIFLKSGLKLTKISLLEQNSTNTPGIILDIKDDFIDVGCKKGSIRVFKVWPPSKKEMNAVEYIRGKRLKIEDILF